VGSVQIEQKSYEMLPKEGISIAHFLTVADIERSARYYEKVWLGGGRLGRPAPLGRIMPATVTKE
jgi:hypothetical protein